ncbi:MAG TPA: polyketide synthase dehydratase domain-containing protein, partial [Kofleriaceae bacterium]|nr:polyketide synthase dehydratase domain-containing protein [Kofleriaceae bacterium]
LAPADAAARIARVADRVAIAAIDGPSRVVLSGDRDALDAIRAALEAEQVVARWLPGAIAEHGPAVDRIRDELVAALADLRPRPAALPLYLTAAEGTAGGPELDAAYWWRNAREPVRFHAAIDRMIDAGCGLFLEIGPDPVLGDAIAACLAARGAKGRALASLRRGEDDGGRDSPVSINEPRQVLASLAALHVAGRDIAWDQLYPAGRVVPLPAYPWKRDRPRTEPAMAHELLGRRLPTATPIWEARLDVEQLPYLADHRIAGSLALPAAGYLEMAAQAVRALGPATCVALGDVELRAPLGLGDAPVALQLAIDPDTAVLRIASPAGAGRDPGLHATAAVRVGATPWLAPPLDVAAIQARAELHRDAAACYGVLAAFGHPVGPAFRAIEELWLSPGEALARVRAPASLGGGAAGYHVHPCLLDACFQALLCPETLIPGAAAGERAIRSIAEIRTCAVGDRPLWVHATITARRAGEITGDLAIHGEAGEPLGAVTGVRMAIAAPTAPAVDAGLLDVAWRELPALPDDARVAAPGVPWVILADAHGFGAELARQLEARGGRAWLVRPGLRFSIDRAQRAATIEPGSSADAGALLAAIASRSESDRCRVVHLWSLDAPALNDASAARLRDAAGHATYALVVVARALIAWEIAGELSIVTRGTQAVSPGAAVEPAGAPAWGVGRVLRDHELIGCRGKLIDLEPGGARAADAARVVRELLAGDEDEVALRGGRRFTPRLTRTPGPEGVLPVRLRPDGAYLVTGAFGAVGRAV